MGLVGSYPDDRMLARDGITLLEDPNQFGLEWQFLRTAVTPSFFFSSPDGDKWMGDNSGTTKCAIPVAKSNRRRLGEAALTEQDAVEACAGVTGSVYRTACIFDVLSMSGSYLAFPRN